MRLPGQGQPTITPLPRFAPSGRSAGSPLHCGAERCGEPTRDGKPWCSRHIATHSPYVMSVVARLEALAAEVNRIVTRAPSARRSPVPCPLLEEDVIHALTHGGRMTLDRLSSTVHVPYACASFVAERLARRRVVELGQTARGVVVVGLRETSP